MQKQAFLQILSPHPGWIQFLDLGQNLLQSRDLDDQVFLESQVIDQVGQRPAQVSVGVQVADQMQPDPVFFVGLGHHMPLGQEVLQEAPPGGLVDHPVVHFGGLLALIQVIVCLVLGPFPGIEGVLRYRALLQGGCLLPAFSRNTRLAQIRCFPRFPQLSHIPHIPHLSRIPLAPLVR